MRYSALSKGDAIQAKILAKNGEYYCAGSRNSMSGSRSGTVNEEALVHRLELMCYKKILSGDLGRSRGPYKTAGKAYNASKPEQTEKYLADKKWWNEKQQNYTKCSRAMLNPHQPTLRQTRSVVELMVADERVRENQTLPAFAAAATEAVRTVADETPTPSPPLRHDMVLDVSVVDRTGKSVVMTISRRLTMKHVKLLLTSGTVPLLGRGLGPGDVTLQINGVVLADNMKVADLCNAVTLHAYIARAEKADGAARRRQRIIPWLDKADIAVVTMPLGLTFGGDGKKATTLAKKAREALALVGLTVADVLFYARDGGEAAGERSARDGEGGAGKKAEEERMRGHGTRGRTAAAATATAAAATLYLGLLKPEECMDVRFESYMLAAAYIWANKGLLMVAIVLSLGLRTPDATRISY
ncbi:hypothetical protein JL720_15727 [Aureococcus anophagefferens]|nr:hypothetical protein JL720_15727 [Aureococcus anophagefferens]